MDNHSLHRADFSLDAVEETSYSGYTDGRTWNGWACPYFEYETAVRVLQDSEANSYQWAYDPAKDAFVIKHKDDPSDFEPEVIQGVSISVERRTLRVYPIGAYSWVWVIAEN